MKCQKIFLIVLRIWYFWISIPVRFLQSIIKLIRAYVIWSMNLLTCHDQMIIYFTLLLQFSKLGENNSSIPNVVQCVFIRCLKHLKDISLIPKWALFLCSLYMTLLNPKSTSVHLINLIIRQLLTWDTRGTSPTWLAKGTKLFPN